MRHTNKLVIGIALALAVAGGGAAIAASDGSRSEESQAVLDDAARQLGISPSKLSDALKTALGHRVDEAVAAGRLTKEQGDALKQRIQSEGFPLFHGPHRGFGHIGKVDAAADYLGLTRQQLRAELAGGKTLAQVAREGGKSVDGLVDALVAAVKERRPDVDTARLRERIEALVNSTRPPHLHRFR
jgi:AraC-like DNA-binding protein